MPPTAPLLRAHGLPPGERAGGVDDRGGAVFERRFRGGSGGYLVQLLPELRGDARDHDGAARGFPSIDAILRGGSTPEKMMDELLYGMPHAAGRLALGYQCRCDTARVLASLATLPRAEVEEMVDAGKTLEINCDYCGAEYRIEPSQLRGLLARS